MFKTKGKFIIVSACAAAVLLSGCEVRKKPAVKVTPIDSVLYFSSGQQSAASTSSAPSESEPSSSAPPESEPDASSSVTSSDVPPQSTPAPDDNSAAVVYNNDPKNRCTITFDGATVIVKGKTGDVLDDVRCDYPPMDIEKTVDGDETTFTLTSQISSFNRIYGQFSIADKDGNLSTVNIKLAENSITLPDVSSYVKNNNRVTNTVVTASETEVARCITRDGSRERIPEILDKVKALSDEICEGIEDDYEKLRAISYWVSDNIYYSYNVFYSGIPQSSLSLEYMLDTKSSVCGGYSTMTSALCAAQGIRCLNVTGMVLLGDRGFFNGLDGEYHEWNVAYIDGRQVIVDSDLNCKSVVHTNGKYEYNPHIYEFFDMGEEIFALRHKAQSAEYRDYWQFTVDS